MRYRKIHIIGGPSSGKSSVASKISTAYDIPAFDLDDIFWDRRADRYGIKAPKEERDRALLRVLQHDSWIIEGVYYRWLSRSFEDAGLIIILTPSVWLRDWRILKRFVKRKLSLIKSKKEKLADLWRLIKWNHGYDTDNLQRARAFIAKLNHKVVDCKTTKDVFTALES